MEVEDCVARFTRAQIEGHALGQWSPTKLFPPLSDLAGKKLADADEDAVRAAIAKSLGIGYAFTVGTEEPGTLFAKTPREIWDVWVPNLHTGLVEQTGLGSMISDIRRIGATTFQREALDLGLGRFGKKARLGHVGAFYAQSGATLRALQSHPEP